MRNAQETRFTKETHGDLFDAKWVNQLYTPFSFTPASQTVIPGTLAQTDSTTEYLLPVTLRVNWNSRARRNRTQKVTVFTNDAN